HRGPIRGLEQQRLGRLLLEQRAPQDLGVAGHLIAQFLVGGELEDQIEEDLGVRFGRGADLQVVDGGHAPQPRRPAAADARRGSYALPSNSYSRRKPSKRRRWPCSSRRIEITMSWVTGSTPSVAGG